MPESNESFNSEEEKLTTQIIAILKRSLEKDYNHEKVLRRFHAKTLGLVRGRLIVKDNLPDTLKVGLFARVSEYPALVRFSNASPKTGNDSKPGMRGMAVKVFMEGQSEDTDVNNARTQDFITTTSDILFPGTPKDMLDAMKYIFARDIQCFRLFIKHPLKTYRFLRSNKKTGSVLEIPYFSGTPYMFGKDRAVKWKFRPMQPAISPLPHTKKDLDFLSRQLASAINCREYGFDLLVQFQNSPEREPLEDSSVRWDTSFHKVAVLMLDKEDIITPDKKTLDETIRFNPWNCLPEHTPLGGNNRIRKEIYAALAEAREKK